jgi:hypothetical protein
MAFRPDGRSLAILGADGQPYRKNGADIEALRKDPPKLYLPEYIASSSIFGGPAHTYWHDRFDEALRHSREDAHAFKRDSRIQALLKERKRSVTQLKWHIDVPDVNDADQKQVRDVVTTAIESIHDFLDVKNCLLEALWYGKYAVQWVWGKCWFKGVKTKVPLRWEPLHGDKLGYQWHDDGSPDTPYCLIHGGSTGFLKERGGEIITSTNGRALLLRDAWRARFTIHHHEIEDWDFWDGEQALMKHGIGLRSQMYWTEYLRKEIESWITDFMERVGLGVTMWKYEAGNDAARQEVQNAALAYDRRVNVFVPCWSDGSGKLIGGVERVDPPLSGCEFLRTLMEYFDRHQERLVIGQEGSAKGMSAGLGNEATADFMKSTKDQIAMEDAGRLGETFTGNRWSPGLVNQIVRWTEWPNPRMRELPARMIFGVESTASDKKMPQLRQLFDMGVDFKQADALAAAGLVAPVHGDAVVTNVELKAAAQQAQMQSQQMAAGTDDNAVPTDGGVKEPPPELGSFLAGLRDTSEEDEPETERPGAGEFSRRGEPRRYEADDKKTSTGMSRWVKSAGVNPLAGAESVAWDNLATGAKEVYYPRDQNPNERESLDKPESPGKAAAPATQPLDKHKAAANKAFVDLASLHSEGVTPETVHEWGKSLSSMSKPALEHLKGKFREAGIDLSGRAANKTLAASQIVEAAKAHTAALPKSSPRDVAKTKAKLAAKGVEAPPHERSAAPEAMRQYFLDNFDKALPPASPEADEKIRTDLAKLGVELPEGSSRDTLKHAAADFMASRAGLAQAFKAVLGGGDTKLTASEETVTPHTGSSPTAHASTAQTKAADQSGPSKPTSDLDDMNKALGRGPAVKEVQAKESPAVPPEHKAIFNEALTQFHEKEGLPLPDAVAKAQAVKAKKTGDATPVPMAGKPKSRIEQMRERQAAAGNVASPRPVAGRASTGSTEEIAHKAFADQLQKTDWPEDVKKKFGQALQKATEGLPITVLTNIRDAAAEEAPFFGKGGGLAQALKAMGAETKGKKANTPESNAAAYFGYDPEESSGPSDEQIAEAAKEFMQEFGAKKSKAGRPPKEVDPEEAAAMQAGIREGKQAKGGGKITEPKYVEKPKKAVPWTREMAASDSNIPTATKLSPEAQAKIDQYKAKKAAHDSGIDKMFGIKPPAKAVVPASVAKEFKLNPNTKVGREHAALMARHNQAKAVYDQATAAGDENKAEAARLSMEGWKRDADKKLSDAKDLAYKKGQGTIASKGGKDEIRANAVAKARQMGAESADLNHYIEAERKQNAEHVNRHNAMLAHAHDFLRKAGYNPESIKVNKERLDINHIPSLDILAREISGAYNDVVPQQGDEGDKMEWVLDALKAGPQKPAGEAELYKGALDQIRAQTGHEELPPAPNLEGEGDAHDQDAQDADTGFDYGAEPQFMSSAAQVTKEEDPADGMTPEQLTAAIPNAQGGANPRREKHVQRILQSPHAKEILGKIPAGSKFLGSGREAMAFRTPQGDVVRVGDVVERPEIPEVLQPMESTRYGDVVVERLPFATDVDDIGDESRDAEDDLKAKIAARGYTHADFGPGTIGKVNGEWKILDPGGMKKTTDPNPGVKRNLFGEEEVQKPTQGLFGADPTDTAKNAASKDDKALRELTTVQTAAKKATGKDQWDMGQIKGPQDDRNSINYITHLASGMRIETPLLGNGYVVKDKDRRKIGGPFPSAQDAAKFVEAKSAKDVKDAKLFEGLSGMESPKTAPVVAPIAKQSAKEGEPARYERPAKRRLRVVRTPDGMIDYLELE